MYPNSNHKQLFNAILKIKSEKEAANFFRDLLTIGEINSASERWQIAKLLWSTKLSYVEIAKKTGASTTTITRVAHWLDHGMGGYQKILRQLLPPKRYSRK